MELKKTNINLETTCPNTWCPGCGDFGILMAFKQAVTAMVEAGTPKENIVVVGDIGCSSKIADYLNLNSFIGLHGRSISLAEGIKMGKSNLKVFVFLGDGGCLDEGISHLIHAAKRNSNITVIMHNNRLFALTTGQFTAVTPKGLKTRSTPDGSIEEPLNPLELLIASNASFVARGYSARIEDVKNLILEADKNKGFSFIEVLQPCVSFYNTIEFYNERVYYGQNPNLESKESALKLAREWNYNGEGRIPLGVIYKIERAVYELEEASLLPKVRNFEKCLQTHL
ncbi:MAG: thiamine pyrophosphate-dependent enzyme [Candidatus Pacebacteria bacterium]|nr:thiamine pyrophosphate-dependent enzyme [Candidatus Paceibacterota bacterium]